MQGGWRLVNVQEGSIGCVELIGLIAVGSVAGCEWSGVERMQWSLGVDAWSCCEAQLLGAAMSQDLHAVYHAYG
jgi:hypothetical protein